MWSDSTLKNALAVHLPESNNKQRGEKPKSSAPSYTIIKVPYISFNSPTIFVKVDLASPNSMRQLG